MSGSCAKLSASGATDLSYVATLTDAGLDSEGWLGGDLVSYAVPPTVHRRRRRRTGTGASDQHLNFPVVDSHCGHSSKRNSLQIPHSHFYMHRNSWDVSKLQTEGKRSPASKCLHYILNWSLFIWWFAKSHTATLLVATSCIILFSLSDN